MADVVWHPNDHSKLLWCGGSSQSLRTSCCCRCTVVFKKNISWLGEISSEGGDNSCSYTSTATPDSDAKFVAWYDSNTLAVVSKDRSYTATCKNGDSKSYTAVFSKKEESGNCYITLKLTCPNCPSNWKEKVYFTKYSRHVDQLDEQLMCGRTMWIPFPTIDDTTRYSHEGDYENGKAVVTDSYGWLKCDPCGQSRMIEVRCKYTNQYRISVTQDSCSYYGYVTGDGTYTYGKKVTLTAGSIPSTIGCYEGINCSFSHWEKDGVRYSTSSSIQVTADADASYVAKYNCSSCGSCTSHGGNCSSSSNKVYRAKCYGEAHKVTWSKCRCVNGKTQCSGPFEGWCYSCSSTGGCSFYKNSGYVFCESASSITSSGISVYQGNC